MANKYFDFYKQTHEQKLVQDLVEESIKIHSIDAIYIPRANVNIDSLFREDTLAKFNDHHRIEVYIKSVDGFDGDGEIFKKFGLDIKNQITFSVSRSRFAKVVGKELERPREGDLIYIPLSVSSVLFEIRFVKSDSVFFNLGEFYVFDLQCEQFAFEDENVDTNIDDIDRISDEGSQIFTIQLEDGSGEFQNGEFIYQGESVLGADARATFVGKISDKQIKVKNLFQSFSTSLGPIKGEKSGAQYTIKSGSDTEEIVDDFGAKNKDFVVIDFTENNPFSEEE